MTRYEVKARLGPPAGLVIYGWRELSCATAWTMVNRFTCGRADDFYMEHIHPLGPLVEWSVVYSTDKGQADALVERLTRLCRPGRVPLARLGPALGVHGGPGTVIVVAKVKRL